MSEIEYKTYLSSGLVLLLSQISIQLV